MIAAIVTTATLHLLLVVAAAAVCTFVESGMRRRDVERSLAYDLLARLDPNPDDGLRLHVYKSASTACACRRHVIYPFEMGDVAACFGGCVVTPSKHHRLIMRLRGEEHVDRFIV